MSIWFPDTADSHLQASIVRAKPVKPAEACAHFPVLLLSCTEELTFSLCSGLPSSRLGGIVASVFPVAVTYSLTLLEGYS